MTTGTDLLSSTSATLVCIISVLLCLPAGRNVTATKNDVHPHPLDVGKCDTYCESINITEADRITVQGALNLEYLEADYFLWASFGYGLDHISPGLSEGGPAPLGVRMANLGPYYDDILRQIGLQEIGHLRISKATIGAEYSIPRPLMNLSKEVFAEAMDKAVGMKLDPPFDPYANSLNYLLSAFTIPYTGVTAYVDASADIVGKAVKLLVAKLLAVESGQNAIIQNELYRRKDEKVVPYNYTTAEFTAAIANLRNSYIGAAVTEGIVVTEALGAEGMITGNILANDVDSVAYTTTPSQTLKWLYQSGDSAIPGGFYPHGANGITALTLLNAGTAAP